MSLRNLAGVFLFAMGCGLMADEPPEDAATLRQDVEQLRKIVLALQARVDDLESARGPGAVTQLASVRETHLISPAQEALPVATTAAPVPGETKSGPLTFNGEFRLYFDSLTRPEGGGAPRVQNIRGRYQMHLDFNARLNRTLSFHGRLSTAPLTNELTDIQDFGAGISKHPFFISEAYVDFHPNPYITLQGGRLDSPFNDKSRFLFDIDTRFNGTTEIFRVPFHDAPFGLKQVQFLAGQYIFTNPNLPIVPAGTPNTSANATPQQALLAAGTTPGTQPRDSALFQQGLIVNQKLGDFSEEAQLDMQIYRNPNQLRLLSTPGGQFLIGTTIGITPSAVQPSPGNATTTPGGSILTASAFRIAHMSYTAAFNRRLPLSLNLQLARNTATHLERDAFAAIVTAGRAQESGDVRVSGAFYQKQANSLISQLTEYDIAIGSNVNMNAYLGRFEYTLPGGIVFINNFIWTKWLRNSDPAANFFVPLGSAVPRQFRYQGILFFRF